MLLCQEIQFPDNAVTGIERDPVLIRVNLGTAVE
jgi:hypothetical protein